MSLYRNTAETARRQFDSWVMDAHVKQYSTDKHAIAVRPTQYSMTVTTGGNA